LEQHRQRARAQRVSALHIEEVAVLQAAGVAALGATTALGGAMGAHMTASIGGGRPLRCVTVHAPHKTSTHALREALGHACLDVSTCRTRK